MSASKKKPSKPSQTRTKAAPKKATQRTKRASPAKKIVAKKQLTPRQPPRPASPAAPRRQPKAFVDKVRDCDAGTGVWFVVAGSVEHAAIHERGADGAVAIVTDAGVTEVVPVRNLFETADEARAARYG